MRRHNNLTSSIVYFILGIIISAIAFTLVHLNDIKVGHNINEYCNAYEVLGLTKNTEYENVCK